MVEAARPSSVTLDVSKQGVLRTLKDQFTRRETVFTELIQNARRAGASRIWIECCAKERRVSISDDGCGIADPATILKVAQSGWNLETIAEENPFGIGFAAALFLAERLAVTTRSFSFEAETSSILDFEPVAIEDGFDEGDYWPSTSVELYFDEETWAGSGERARSIPRMLGLLESESAEFGGLSYRLDVVYRDATIVDRLRGFPTPISIQKADLRRPRALDGDEEFVRFRFGFVAGIDQVLKSNNGRVADSSVSLYFQGLPIDRDTFRLGRSPLCVHLDSCGPFRARVPDRDSLVDPERSKKEIYSALEERLREELTTRKAELEPAEFVCTYGRACEVLDTGLLSDLPIPAWSYDRLDSITTVESEDLRTCYLGSEVVNQSDVESEGLLTLDFHSPEMWDISGPEDSAMGPGYGTIPGVYAYALGWPVLTWHNLPDDHWCREYLVNLDELDYEVVVHGEREPRLFCGEGCEFWYAFCDRIDLRDRGGRLPAVTLDSSPIHQERKIGTSGDVVRCVLIPLEGDVFDSEQALLGIDGYRDDTERRQEEQLESDSMVLHQLRDIARGGDPARILAHRIDIGCGDPIRGLVAGQSFHVEFDENGRAQVTPVNPIEAT